MYISGFALTSFPETGKGRADRKNQAVNLHKKEGHTVQRKKTFLVACLSILMVVARGQQAPSAPVEKIVPDHLTLTKIPLGSVPSGAASEARQRPLLPFPGTNADLYRPGREAAYMGGGSYYTSTLGFFCKRELEVQKAIRLPVFFRLGSLEYCNRLEGK